MIVRSKVNKCFAQVFHTDARYILLWGGRGRGGSYFGTDYFLHKLTHPSYFRGYFMRAISGDIRQSLFQEFLDRIEENDSFEEDDFDIEKNKMLVRYPTNGNIIESKGFKKAQSSQTAKMKSIAGATHVIIEEAEETGEEEFRQLDDSLRTNKSNIQIILIFNPPHKNHWIMKRWFNLVESVDFKGYYSAIPKSDKNLLAIHTTYTDNVKNLNESSVYNYSVTYRNEYIETGNEYYPINVKGLVSEGKIGRVFHGCEWKPITIMPNAYDSSYCLDFGFGGDPLALVEKKAHNNKRFYRELIYETGLTNPALSEKLKAFGLTKADLIIADSAEPKSIAELRELGWNVVSAVKGPGSVSAGINTLRSLDIHIMEDSTNIWKEYEDYVWMLDKDKRPTNKAKDKDNHAIDAMRYGETKTNRFKI